MTQDWTIKTGGEQVVVIADDVIYGAYENEAIAREEWDRVTDYEWKIRRLHRMVDFSDNQRRRLPDFPNA